MPGIKTAIAVAALISCSVSVMANDEDKIISFNINRTKTNEIPWRAPGHFGTQEPSLFAKTLFEVESFLAGLTRSTASFDTNVFNVYNFQYYTNIYLGSQNKAFQVIIDTGSNKLIILDSSCTQCVKTFDTTTSTSYVSSTITDSISYLDGSYIVGYKVGDRVSIDALDNYSVNGFNFLLGMREKGFSEMDGLIGMTRTTDTTYKIFYHELNLAGLTNTDVFAFYMTDVAYQSSFQIGGYDTSYFAQPLSALPWVPLSDSSLFWNVNIDGFRVGTNDQISWNIPGGYYLGYYSTATLDTGTSLMLVPKELYNTITKMILDGKRTTKDRAGNLYATCDFTQYGSLYLLMGSRYFEIPPQSYMISFGNPTWCFYGLQASGDHNWLLGDVFLRNFYSVWDNANNRVGLTPHKTSLSVAKTTTDMARPAQTFSQANIIVGIVKQVAKKAIELSVEAALLSGIVYGVYMILKHFGILQASFLGLEASQELFYF